METGKDDTIRYSQIKLSLSVTTQFHIKTKAEK